jgi:ribosomal protein L36
MKNLRKRQGTQLVKRGKRLYLICKTNKRFKAKQSFDIYLKAKMAGAQDLEEVEDWMNDIHP